MGRGVWPGDLKGEEGNGVVGKPGHKPGRPHSFAGPTSHPIAPGVRSLEVSGQCLADLSHFLVIKS